MKIYVAHLKLSDFLTFSSNVGFVAIGRGQHKVSYTVYKPQPYLHNYALMYAFSGLLHASLASAVERRRTAIQKEIDYAGLSTIERNLYVYPAKPKKLSVKRLVANITGEGFIEVQVRPKGAYPWHVVHLCFAPGSEFETVVVTKENVRLPSTIRVGVKRQGVFDVLLEPANVAGETAGYSDPVNLGDVLKAGIRPKHMVVLLRTKTVRKGIPCSNIIARIYLDRLAVIKSRTAKFMIPLITPGGDVGGEPALQKQ